MPIHCGSLSLWAGRQQGADRFLAETRSPLNTVLCEVLGAFPIQIHDQNVTVWVIHHVRLIACLYRLGLSIPELSIVL